MVRKNGRSLSLQGRHVRLRVGLHVLVKPIVLVKGNVIMEVVFGREPHDGRIQVHVQRSVGSGSSSSRKLLGDKNRERHRG